MTPSALTIQEQHMINPTMETVLALRVIELEKQVHFLTGVLEALACLGNGDKYGNSIGNVMAQRALKMFKEME